MVVKSFTHGCSLIFPAVSCALQMMIYPCTPGGTQGRSASVAIVFVWLSLPFDLRIPRFATNCAMKHETSPSCHYSVAWRTYALTRAAKLLALSVLYRYTSLTFGYFPCLELLALEANKLFFFLIIFTFYFNFF